MTLYSFFHLNGLKCNKITKYEYFTYLDPCDAVSHESIVISILRMWKMLCYLAFCVSLHLLETYFLRTSFMMFLAFWAGLALVSFSFVLIFDFSSLNFIYRESFVFSPYLFMTMFCSLRNKSRRLLSFPNNKSLFLFLLFAKVEHPESTLFHLGLFIILLVV